MSRAGLPGDDNYTPLITALCELINRIWVQGRRVEAYPVPSIKMRSAREAARLGAGQSVLRDNEKCWFSFFSASEEIAQRRGLWLGRRMTRVIGLRYGEEEVDESTKARRREPDIGMSFARRAEILSVSGIFIMFHNHKISPFSTLFQKNSPLTGTDFSSLCLQRRMREGFSRTRH